MFYDLTHIPNDAECPIHDKDGLDIPDEIREFITARRKLTEQQKMLIDMADAHERIRQVLDLCKTDMSQWDKQSPEMLSFKSKIFGILEFGGLSLANWNKNFSLNE